MANNSADYAIISYDSHYGICSMDSDLFSIHFYVRRIIKYSETIRHFSFQFRFAVVQKVKILTALRKSPNILSYLSLLPSLLPTALVYLRYEIYLFFLFFLNLNQSKCKINNDKYSFFIHAQCYLVTGSLLIQTVKIF